MHLCDCAWPTAENDARPTRLPNGLTPAQDAAFDALAVALAEHLTRDIPPANGGAA